MAADGVGVPGVGLERVDAFDVRLGDGVELDVVAGDLSADRADLSVLEGCSAEELV